MKPQGLLTLAVIVCFLSTAGCRHETAYQKPLVPVRVQPVDLYSPDEGIRYSATLLPYSQVDLAFRVGGYVQEIQEASGTDGRKRLIQDGDPISKSSLLARVRLDDYQARLNQARSQVNEAEAGTVQADAQIKELQVSLDLARIDFERAGRLFEKQSITKPEYDSYKAKYDSARERIAQATAALNGSKSRIDRARNAVAESQLSYDDTTLHAPVDGILLRRNVELGALVSPGVPAFTIADITSVKAVFGVPDISLRDMRPGTYVPISTASLLDRTLGGHVTRVSTSADTRTRLFEVELTIPNTNRALKPGMIVSLQLGAPPSREQIPVVPLTAVIRSKTDPDGYAVLLIEAQGEKRVVRARNVQLAEAFGNRIGVKQGLRAGDLVVVSGAGQVSDGDAVFIFQ